MKANLHDAHAGDDPKGESGQHGVERQRNDTPQRVPQRAALQHLTQLHYLPAPALICTSLFSSVHLFRIFIYLTLVLSWWVMCTVSSRVCIILWIDLSNEFKIVLILDRVPKHMSFYLLYIFRITQLLFPFGITSIKMYWKYILLAQKNAIAIAKLSNI